MSTRLRQIGPDIEVPDSPPTPPVRNPAEQAALNLLLMSLKALGQRAVVALAALFTLVAAVSVWWLFYMVLSADPTTHQLTGLGLYSLFVLAIHVVKRRQ